MAADNPPLPTGETGTVYLIHFDTALAHARHYTGWTHGHKRNVRTRLDYHMRGQGSRLMRAVCVAGIGVKIARTWENVDRNFERQIKRRKAATRLCPVCAAEKKRAAKENRRANKSPAVAVEPERLGGNASTHEAVSVVPSAGATPPHGDMPITAERTQ